MNYDYWGEKVHYNRFDRTFLGQNLNLILETEIRVLNKSFIEIYWKENLEAAENIISEIAGASVGYISGLLYLKDRNKYNILIEKLKTGILNLFPNTSFPDDFRLKYLEYNKLVNGLKERFKIEPQEIDIILTVTANQQVE